MKSFRVVVVLLLGLLPGAVRSSPEEPRAGSPAVTRGPASADSDWPTGRFARSLRSSVRCRLVREVFSANAFETLYGYLNGTGCGMRARVAGRAQVAAYVGGQPVDDKSGLGPIEWMFGPNEKCEGTGFVVLGPKGFAHLGPKPVWVQLEVTPTEKDRYRFGVSVAVPNGLMGCASVSGEASLRTGRWTLRKTAGDSPADKGATQDRPTGR
jgi:hypothetical protein